MINKVLKMPPTFYKKKKPLDSLLQAVPLLEEAPLPCINHIYGCPHKDLGKRLALHAPNCLYNQVNYA